MSIALREVIRQPRIFERGSGKDVFFGEQIFEQYTAAVCATGDKEISCRDITSEVCSSYVRVFGCCDPGDGGCGISVGCRHCEQKSTGQRECQCERKVEQPALDINAILGKIGGGAQAPETFPVGAAGTTLAPAPGKTLTGVLVVGVLAVVGYFLYKRSTGGGTA